MNDGEGFRSICSGMVVAAKTVLVQLPEAAVKKN